MGKFSQFCALSFALISIAISDSSFADCRRKVILVASPNPRMEFSENIVRPVRLREIPRELVLNSVGVDQSLKVVELETVGGERFADDEIFPIPADLTIGIATDGNTGGHMWIGFRGLRQSYRFDGRLFFRPSEFAARWRLSNGLIVRFQTIPLENRRRMQKIVDSGRIIRSATCVACAFDFLYRYGGFKKNFPKGPPFFPSTFLAYLAQYGLTGADGVRLVPELYTINRHYEDFWQNRPTVHSLKHYLLPVLLNPTTWGARQFEP